MSFNEFIDYRGYAIDVVFCIDATGTMAESMEEIKCVVLKFGEKLNEVLEESGRCISDLREKVITFRDFSCDEDALISSPFYTLPEETDEFQQFVNGIKAQGGGDEPENGLEALAEAMNSNWTNKRKKRRHIIVLFTDASAIKLEDSAKGHPQYPANAPASLSELHDWWENGTPNGSLQQAAKRLIIFAPDAEPWNMIKYWNQTEVGPAVRPGSGCAEAIMDKVCEVSFKDYAPVWQ